jgi:Ser/Thr protein kinase RdoA (MazF antagonist)
MTPFLTPAGRVILLTGILPLGRSHNIHTGYDQATGQAVVVKTGGDPARLRHESHVLTVVADTAPTLAPRLLEFATEHPHPCLVLEHLSGRHPQTVADWAAFGAILADLHNTAVVATAFRRNSLDLLRPAAALAAAQAPHLLRTVRVCADAAAGGVLVHGDASPQNVLVRGHDATLIDFENAFSGHPGLDVGRAIFLIHLGELPSRCCYTHSFLAGYRLRRPLPDRLPAWTCLSGLLIAAWRHSHDHVPPWQAALALADDLAGNPIRCHGHWRPGRPYPGRLPA